MATRTKQAARRARDAAASVGIASRELIAPGFATASTSVSERTALGESVTHRCVEILADGVAGARWGEWRGDVPLEESRLVRRPAELYTRRQWTWRVVATMALYSWCPLLRVGPSDAEGVIGSLVPVLPADVSRDPDGSWRYRGVLHPAGVRVVLRQVWPGLDAEVAGVLVLAREAFAAALAASAFDYAFWESGGAPRTVITTEQALTADQANELRAMYVTQRQANPGAPAVFGKGAKLEAFGLDYGTAGALDAASRIGAAVARYFGIPPHLANVPNYASSMLYQNAETAGIDLVRYTLSAIAEEIGDALTAELPGDRAARLNLRHLTAAEQESRFRSYASAIGLWMTREEVRELEGLPPVPRLGELPDLATPDDPEPAPEPIPVPVPQDGPPVPLRAVGS